MTACRHAVAIAALAFAATAAPAVHAGEPAQRVLGVTVAASEQTDANGIATDTVPSLQPWEAATRARIGVAATFIAWGSGADPVAFARAALESGETPLITWESWVPGTGGAARPGFANAEIAQGRWDGYVRRVADGLQDLSGTIYIRFDHEMNGDWYPWHDDPTGYVAAWRHVVDVFRAEGAGNVQWVWAPNAGWTTAGWLASVRPYWPGSSYVNWVGLTTQERYEPMAVYARHLDLINAVWTAKPVMLPETNVMTLPYMRAFVGFVLPRPWIRLVTWYERPGFGTLLARPLLAAAFGRLSAR